MVNHTRQAVPASSNDGSRTITQDPAQIDDEPNIGTLRLNGGSSRTHRRVVWDEDVVDNEGCGRKKSKICCIYHKPKQFDESSDEDSSDSDSDSDSPCNDGHDHIGPTHSHHHHQPWRSERGQLQRAEGALGGSYGVEDNSEHKNAYEVCPGGKKDK